LIACLSLVKRCLLVTNAACCTYPQTLHVEDAESMVRLLQQIDKANGYCFGSVDAGARVDDYAAVVAGAGTEWEYEKTMAVQEKYMTARTGSTAGAAAPAVAPEAGGGGAAQFDGQDVSDLQFFRSDVKEALSAQGVGGEEARAIEEELEADGVLRKERTVT